MDIEKLKLIGIGVVILVGLYFLFSPYQNCLRIVDDPKRDWKSHCVKETGW